MCAWADAQVALVAFVVNDTDEQADEQRGDTCIYSKMLDRKAA